MQGLNIGQQSGTFLFFGSKISLIMSLGPHSSEYAVSPLERAALTNEEILFAVCAAQE